MSVVLANVGRYRRSRKKLKSQMLDELAAVLHDNRRYLATLLRASGRCVFTHYRTRVVADPRVSLASSRGRKKTYTAELLLYLKATWELADGISSVHLAAFIRDNPDVVFRNPKLHDIPARLKRQLTTISPATIDRLLDQPEPDIKAARDVLSRALKAWPQLRELIEHDPKYARYADLLH